MDLDGFKETAKNLENGEEMMEFFNKWSKNITDEAAERRKDLKAEKDLNKEQNDLLEKMYQTTKAKDKDELLEKINNYENNLNDFKEKFNTFEENISKKEEEKRRAELSSEILEQMNNKSLIDGSGLIKKGLIESAKYNKDSDSYEIDGLSIENFLQKQIDNKSFSIDFVEEKEIADNKTVITKESIKNMSKEERTLRRAEIFEAMKAW